jgi:Kef-type K+ transport system membrane component KefB
MPLAAPAPTIGHHALLVFLLQVAFLLLPALVLGRLAMRFSLPAVTGELLAGVLVGPSSCSRYCPTSPAGCCPNRQRR